jgi:anthranilate phosphoribosyltransferase
MQQPHSFAQYVRILGRGKQGTRSLTFDEAYAAMSMIVANEVEPIQLGAFLMLLRVKEESPEELAGFVKAMRDHIAAPASMGKVDLDWSSYAGKRQHHPWFLLAAFTLADHGIRIFMHGTSGHTAGRLYTEDALRQLAVPISTDWQHAGTALERDNFAFMPIASCAPDMEQLLQLKPLLGLRSVANSMARLLNPTNATASIHSIFHPRYGEIHQQTLEILGQPAAAVFKGEGGEVERKPDASCDVLELDQGISGRTNWSRLIPGRGEKTDLPATAPLVTMWRDEQFSAYGHGAIIGTVAIALRILRPNLTTENALQEAKRMWDSRNRSRL